MIQDEILDRLEVCPWRERRREGPYVCTRFIDTIIPCDDACSWVADYPKLKRFKYRIISYNGYRRTTK